MNPLVPLVFVLPLLAFDLRMFRDMAQNEYLTTDERARWAWAFILLNVFAAAAYDVNEYRNRG